MALHKIRFINFRNLSSNTVNISSKNTFLIGDNGQGKSNFIESIYLSCFGSSYRTINKDKIINNKENECFLEANFLNNHVESTITLKFKKEGRKEILLNSNPVNDRKELILSNPCIVFSNNDMQLITGAPKIKRRFFNQTISLVDIFFIDLLRRYNTLLKNRNILLKEKRYNLLPVYDKQLSKEGLKLQSIRNKTIHSFNETFTQVYQDLTKSDRSMRIIYKPGWKNIKTEDEAEDLLKKTIERDKMLLFTSSGPHRDNIQYYLDGEDYTQFASTGQIRLLSLILKLSQAVFFNRIKKKRVILLLDDVLLELDPEKKQSFFNILPPYEQAFFTFLPDEKYLNYANKDTKLYLVQNGNITEWKKQAIS